MLHRQKTKKTGREGEKGFTLLEILVAAAILGFGLLAIGTGETISVGTGRTAREISIATASAEEILERMRRNPTLGGYSGFDTANAGTQPGGAGMLRDDYDAWKARIEQPSPYGLPGGRGTVAVAPGPILPTQLVTVTVTWGAPLRTVTVQAVF